MARGRQERQAAKLTWEAHPADRALRLGHGRLRDRRADCRSLGCELLQVSLYECRLAAAADRDGAKCQNQAGTASAMSGPGPIFRLSGGDGLWITVRVELGREPDLASDIVFRYLERLGQALAGRLEWFQFIESSTAESWIKAAGTGIVEPRSTLPSPSRGELHGTSGVIARILGLRLHVPGGTGQCLPRDCRS